MAVVVPVVIIEAPGVGVVVTTAVAVAAAE